MEDDHLSSLPAPTYQFQLPAVDLCTSLADIADSIGYSFSAIQKKEQLLSVMAMNQLANIPISISRKQADAGHEEALGVWMLWHNLVKLLTSAAGHLLIDLKASSRGGLQGQSA